jgi:hypothetical protein
MTTKDDKSYDFYIVSIIDILGQSEKLNDLEIDPAISRESEEFAKFNSLMRDTIGGVIEFRESIKELNNAFTKDLVPPEGFSDEQKEVFRKYSTADVTCNFFSDLAILNISLKGNPHPVSSISSLFYQLSLLFLSSLAKGIPLRGAIDVGQCMKMEDGDIYGSGLYRAYELERKTSGYPRIVIGGGFKEYWASFGEIKPDTPENRFVLRMLGVIQGYVERDDDGEYVLSYLAPGFIEAYGGMDSEGLKEILHMASKFVQSEIDKYSGGVDDILFERYTKVKEYFIRKDCWKL